MTTRRQFIAQSAALGSAVTLGLPALAQSDAAESTWARIQRTKVLRTGAVAGASPYYDKSLSTGQWSGFMIDFEKMLAEHLGVKLELHETTWGNSVLDLQSNKLDVFFGLNPTPARALVVDFSEPLFNNAFMVIAKKGYEPKTWAEMNKPEVKIAVDVGSSHDQMIGKVCPQATIIRLEKAADATMAVQTGRADAQVLASVLALTVASKNPTLGKVLLPMPMEATTTTLGFRKETDRTWINYVNKWIGQIRADGKVKEVVLANLEKLSGLKREQVPAQLGF